MRFAVILVLFVLAVLAGLYFYGDMLEPETQVITQEAENEA